MTPKQVRLIKPAVGYDTGTVLEVQGWNEQTSPSMPKVETRGGPKYLFSGEWEPVEQRRPQWVRLKVHAASRWGGDVAGHPAGTLIEPEGWDGQERPTVRLGPLSGHAEGLIAAVDHGWWEPADPPVPAPPYELAAAGSPTPDSQPDTLAVMLPRRVAAEIANDWDVDKGPFAVLVDAVRAALEGEQP